MNKIIILVLAIAVCCGVGYVKILPLYCQLDSKCFIDCLEKENTTVSYCKMQCTDCGIY